MSGVEASYRGHNPDRFIIRSQIGGLTGAIGRDLDERSRRVLAQAQLRAPLRTGTLLASIVRIAGQDETGPYFEIRAGVPGLTDYLQYVLTGTPPHVIRPRRRRALRFIQNGQVRFATKVNHPGTRANNFLLDALAAAA